MVTRRSQFKQASAPTTAALILPASSFRVALTFSPHATDTYFVRPDSAIAGGFAITPGGGALSLSVEAHGDVVNHAWFASTAAASASTIYLLETVTA
jgi:hypothetical protein